MTYFLGFQPGMGRRLYAAADAAPDLPAPDTVRYELLGFMDGFPPVPEKLVTRANYLVEYPKLRWAFQHMRELIPSRQVRRGSGAASELPRGTDLSAEIDALRITLNDGSEIDFPEFLSRSYADACVILHRGKVVYEHYPNQPDPLSPHMLWSVTKSFTGLIAAMLIAEGVLDPTAQVTDLIPELASSGWRGANVQQVLDMTADIKYSEVYADGTSDVKYYGLSAGITESPQWTGPTRLYDYLPTIGAAREHGRYFAYRTVHTEVLGWLVRRVSGKDVATQIAERIWSKLGAEEDALVLLDPTGTEWAGAGLNAMLRDLARFAEMMRNGGRWNGQQIVPEPIINDIRAGADRDAFADFGRRGMEGYSYHNQWWISHNPDGVYEAMGVHGQLIHINPAAELTVVRTASHPIASNEFTYEMTSAAMRALASLLRS
ncbi:MAG: serine hydrolase [Pseudomonadaceae bacterium]